MNRFTLAELVFGCSDLKWRGKTGEVFLVIFVSYRSDVYGPQKTRGILYVVFVASSLRNVLVSPLTSGS
jgi:hypothetical protein